jgi:hypothetical protein
VSKAETLRAALTKLLEEHRRDGALPTSARFLFYELISRRILSKHSTGKRRPEQDMIDALTHLRGNGVIPWSWIVDETRSIDDFTGFPTIQEGILAYLPTIGLDPWAGKPPLILTESRSLAGALRELCRQYTTRIAATNGQCGGFLHTEIAPILEAGQRILYLGDFDLAGNDIERNTRHVLEREAGRLQWERLALIREQVNRYNLPSITKHDRRFKGEGGVHQAVETEALSQRIIIEIVRSRLDALLPEPLESIQERAARERAAISRRLSV